MTANDLNLGILPDSECVVATKINNSASLSLNIETSFALSLFIIIIIKRKKRTQKAEKGGDQLTRNFKNCPIAIYGQ